MEVVDMKEIKEGDLTKVTVPLAEYLKSKRERCRQKVEVILASLREPTTVSEIAKLTGVSKPTIAKIILKSLKEGNAYGLAVKKVGTYEIVYKEVREDGTQGRESGRDGTELGRGQQAGCAGEQVLQAGDEHKVPDVVQQRPACEEERA
jgi:hypothetical protein